MSTDSNMAGIAAAINSRISSEGRVLRATAFCWSCGGAAIAMLLTAGGVAIAFAGYSQLISVKPAADEVAKALVISLESAELRTTVTGTMALSGNTEIKLAPGQRIKLQEGSTVALDPSSSVRVVGDLKLDYPQPSKEQLQLGLKTKSDELPFTSYTIFRTVAFSTGKVVSGWKFDLDNPRPKFQYCYFAQNVDTGVARNQTIAINGSPNTAASSSRLGFNLEAAVSNCAWFAGL
jgi:hypothetical protein